MPDILGDQVSWSNPRAEVAWIGLVAIGEPHPYPCSFGEILLVRRLRSPRIRPETAFTVAAFPPSQALDPGLEEPARAAA